MSKYLPFLFLLFLISCGSEPEVTLTEEEIDEYVEECLDTSVVYDVVYGLRFSKNAESYQVNEYSLNDTSVLFTTQEVTETSTIQIDIFYKDSLPVFYKELRYDYPNGVTEMTERKIYLGNQIVQAAYERKAGEDEDINDKEYTTISIRYDQLDFQRPKDAILQKGDYEMKYGEFLIINPDSYLILENDKSGYGIALFILQGDMLLDELYGNPEKYRGKAVFAHHEFMTINGIERMIYRGGIVKETD
ncbi:hypothetical protein K6119_15985 [Paracrocinitomix mangrovi]|uniref:hypothetical protein n=1 Tax=Paracrocinitomix mangrovi TaxID=2862509 RepID=UPI001C8E0591|nr:hypothetical protein [Paracrocinitomix mangrovi]UKN01229.1 hypothetical protein K6119_15985 [Paracrocinitomix mangrovi]